MSPPIIHLPLDLSGEAVTNKVTAELHNIPATGNRAVVTQRGPFFTRNLVVRNANTGAELVPDVDYRPVHLFLEATLRATQEICSVVLILPTSNASAIEIDYQAIGGEYSASISSIEQMLESLDLDNRTIYWGDLIGAPEYFPPAAHLHDVGDLYGFEYLVAVLEQIRRAILMGDQAAFDELRQYIDIQIASLRDLLESSTGQIEEHIGNLNNPHQTTKAHVGLGSVQNYGVATATQADAATANNVYMTPLRTRETVMRLVGDAFNAHAANLNNPHQTTKAHVGLGNVANYSVATQAQAVAGAANNVYVTPLRVRDYVDEHAIKPLNTHTANTDNPHNVTKAQVGLSNVQNYGVATVAQGQDGTATNLYMTPATTRAAILTVVGNDLSSHISNTNNPHNVTKAQVGLSSVLNEKQVINNSGHAVRIGWSGTELVAVVDSSSIGRIHTTNTPDPRVGTHISATDNPHSVTKAQVGLGSVQDYGIASAAQAQAGTSNALYMTPLRVANAITSQAITPLTALINQRVTTGSNGQLATLTINTKGYLHQTSTGISLRVNGNRYYNFLDNGNFVANNGRVIGSTGFQPSDLRFKERPRPVEARPLWRELSFIEYFDKRLQVEARGLAAQETQVVAPDRVYEFDYEEANGESVKRLAVDYVGIAVEGMFALGDEVDRLKGQLAEIEKRLAKLEG